MPEVQLIARYTIQPGRQDEVLRLLRQLAEASREEPGNGSFEVYRRLDDDRGVVLLERYESTEAVDAHRETEHFRRLVLSGVVPLLESRVVEAFEVPE